MAIRNVVIDASFSGAWILPDEVSAAAEVVLQSIEKGELKACVCLLYTSPSPRDKRQSRMPSSA